MTDTNSTPNAAAPAKPHHFHWRVLLAAVAIAALGVWVFVANGGNVRFANGGLDITNPDLTALRSRVRIVQNPDGGKTITIAPPATADQPAALPNGQSTATLDGFDGDHRLQRTRQDTDRFDPIDRLTTLVKATADAVQANSDATTHSIKSMRDEVVASLQKVNDRVDTLGSDLTSQIKIVDGKVKDQGTLLGDLTARVSKIETASAQPAPAPQPAPQASPAPQALPNQVAPAPQPLPQVQPEPAPQPQAALPSPTKVAQAGTIVTPRNADEAQMKMMLQAYRDLGTAPNGAKIAGFQQIGRGEIFTCPNGQPGTLVKAARDGGGVAARWMCK